MRANAFTILLLCLAFVTLPSCGSLPDDESCTLDESRIDHCTL